MIFDNTQVFMIEALGGEFKYETLNSFSETNKEFKISNISIVKELETREKTLNLILKKRDLSKDLFIFVDDIIFLKGWYRSLSDNAKDGLIIGFSMLKPDGKSIQDFGYDIINLDGNLSTQGLYKGDLVDNKKLPSFRKCSAVCGCAMWISKKVLNNVKQFPLEGKNRWGEMIFSNLARRQGFETIVLASHLIHHGSSTKQNDDPLLSSNSWLIERDMWNLISSKYFHDAPIVKNLNSRFTLEFSDIIKASKKLLIYGCGTVSDLVTNSYQNEIDADYASSLPEEIGKKFHDKIIKNFNKINFLNYDIIFISSVGYEKEIIKLVPKNFRNKILCVKKSIKNNYIDYAVCEHKYFFDDQN